MLKTIQHLYLILKHSFFTGSSKKTLCCRVDLSQTSWKSLLLHGEVRLSNALLLVVVLGVFFKHVQHFIVVFLRSLFHTCTGTTQCTLFSFFFTCT